MISILACILLAFFPFVVICGNTEEENLSTTPKIDLELRLSPYQRSAITQSSSLNTGEQTSHTTNTDHQIPQLLIKNSQHRLLTDEQRRDGVGKPSKKVLLDRFKMRQQREEIVKAVSILLKCFVNKLYYYLKLTSFNIERAEKF